LSRNRRRRREWLDHAAVAKLKALRGPGESYNDVIIRGPPFAEQQCADRV
jgi:hypothetical protein